MAKQVLIVDDDQNTVKYLSVVLSEHGYNPIAAYDGNEGLQKVEQATPDLVVLDVMMPKKTGLMLTGVSGVLEELESHQDETFEKPYDSLREALKKQILEMREEGLIRPEMFVDKPVDPDSFIAQVQQLIGN